MKNIFVNIFYGIVILILIIAIINYSDNKKEKFTNDYIQENKSNIIYSGYFLVPPENINYCPAGEICQNYGVCINSGYPCAIETFNCPSGYKFNSRGLTSNGKHQLGNCIPENWPNGHVYSLINRIP